MKVIILAVAVTLWGFPMDVIAQGSGPGPSARQVCMRQCLIRYCPDGRCPASVYDSCARMCAIR